VPINYALFENNLTPAPGDFAAQVQPTGSADTEAVVVRMTERGSTTTRADIAAVLEDMFGAVESLLLDGRRVTLGGLVDLFVRIGGTFSGPGDSFDPARHRLDVAANPGARIREAVRAGAQVTKAEATKPAPNLIEYKDLGSNETNDGVTPGNIGTISGNRLKFNAPAADEGVFFVHATGNAGPVKVSAVQTNKPGQLVFLVPALSAGGYFIEVRARLQGGQGLRTGRLDSVLTV